MVCPNWEVGRVCVVFGARVFRRSVDKPRPYGNITHRQEITIRFLLIVGKEIFAKIAESGKFGVMKIAGSGKCFGNYKIISIFVAVKT
jgi:hypothetical protein